MLEIYYKYKLKYREYIIIIKVGNFYECLSKDALIINNLFNYKLNKISNNFKVGFPINNISKITNILEEKHLYYIIVDNDKIINKYNNGKNNYSKYKFDIESILYNYLRIENIIKYLNDNITSDDIENKLDNIENIILKK